MGRAPKFIKRSVPENSATVPFDVYVCFYQLKDKGPDVGCAQIPVLDTFFALFLSVRIIC